MPVFRLVTAFGCVVLSLPLLLAPGSAGASALVAVADIGFTDSSGEAGDQRAVHEDRRRGLTEGVRADIGREGSLESLPLPCEAACRLDAEGVEVLRQRARQAGAGFLLVGSVHKMSTLILSLRVAVLDADTGKLVFERLLSFRGDNDEGWRHAGDYVAREVAEQLPAQ
ncbi:DUF2380 domain-containing protein [Ancylobacter dichloromethanicus]|uniref:DUF2380 domain-containing protein n=1 Tax=Ancylobacter dichloromethanicus TaxID=518825 RepID=A0A9W6J7Y6_9HYPH|nr:DUF2380 domain-containing protein [Ancylobacter dichloromethanicus]MBS7553853.1 DUF2380 domain-containing protein [Ancylobacter dichloromethanicus]GLK70958.1 hypothetical protein GCM10017643_10730 [Ancylobacter dichloromethanicus]